jgi:hypothetical protein
MHLAGVQRLTCSLPAASRLHSLTSRHLTARPSSLRLVGLPVRGTQIGWSVSDRRQIQRLINSTLAQIAFAPGSTTSPERSEDMRPSHPCVRLLCTRLAWLLGPMPLAGLSSYRPVSSDNAPNLEPRTSVGGPPLSEHGASPDNDPVTPAASPLPRASRLPGKAMRARRPPWLCPRGWPKNSIPGRPRASPGPRHVGAAEPGGEA